MQHNDHKDINKSKSTFTNSSSQRMQKIAIFHDTLDYCKTLTNLKQFQTPSEKHNLITSKQCKNELSTIYNTIESTHKTNIYVVNDDVIECTLQLNHILKNQQTNNKQTNILVLNLASHKHYGGGVASGAMAQEEELFRKTDYYFHDGEHLYPLKNNEYTSVKNVSIVKYKNYDRIQPNEIIQIDCLAISAICQPKLIDDENLSKNDYRLTEAKIENIFLHAIKNNNKNLILGALGCGVFRNPPEDIIKIYNTYLTKYHMYFDNIIFSVYSLRDNNHALFHAGIKRFY